MIYEVKWIWEKANDMILILGFNQRMKWFLSSLLPSMYLVFIKYSCFHLLLFGILEHLLLFSWSSLLIIGNEFLKLSFEFSLWNSVIPRDCCSALKRNPFVVQMKTNPYWWPCNIRYQVLPLYLIKQKYFWVSLKV